MCYGAILVFNTKRTRGFHAAYNTVEIARQSMFYTRDSSRKGHDCNLKLFLIAPCIKKKFFEIDVKQPGKVVFTAGQFGRCPALNEPPEKPSSPFFL